MQTNADGREIKTLSEADLDSIVGGAKDIVAYMGGGINMVIWATADGHGVTSSNFDHPNP